MLNFAVWAWLYDQDVFFGMPYVKPVVIALLLVLPTLETHMLALSAIFGLIEFQRYCLELAAYLILNVVMNLLQLTLCVEMYCLHDDCPQKLIRKAVDS